MLAQTAHLDTHEEYTEELKEKIDSEQEYYNEIFSRSQQLDEDLVEFDNLQDEPTVYYSKLEEALQHKHHTLMTLVNRNQIQAST